jgi:hypothetical protein
MRLLGCIFENRETRIVAKIHTVQVQTQKAVNQGSQVNGLVPEDLCLAKTLHLLAWLATAKIALSSFLGHSNVHPVQAKKNVQFAEYRPFVVNSSSEIYRFKIIELRS